jgi:trans-2,3-dihydro-3-hydroxyanthranilate isomerase
LPHAYDVESDENPGFGTAGNGSGLSRRSFLRLAACVPTSFMRTRKANIPRGERQAGPIEVVHTRVFPAGPEGGNPCPVIPTADRLTDNEMQHLARKFGLDTVFILRPQSKAADIRLRYFVPDHEMGVSGHATIAAITVALLDHLLTSNDVRIETITGLFEVESIPREDRTVVTLEQNAPVFGPTVAPDMAAKALKIDPGQIVLTNGPIQPVSVSRAKLLVPLQDWRALDALKPDFETLWTLCDKLQVTGLYPFTRQTDKPNADAEARQFPLRAGFPEDAATGVAAAALGAYLATHDRKCQQGHHQFRIAQGYAMGAPSLIEAIADCTQGKITKTAIRGMAQIVRRDQVNC